MSLGTRLNRLEICMGVGGYFEMPDAFATLKEQQEATMQLAQFMRDYGLDVRCVETSP